MLKKLLLVLWSCIVAVISFRTFIGMYFWNENREFALFWLSITIIIFLIYVMSLIILRKKVSRVFLLLNMLLYIVIVINGPRLQLLSLQIKHYFEIPSQKLQTQMNLEVSNAIEKSGIPYEVDFEISRELTEEGGRVAVVLVKNNKEEVNKSEVHKILGESLFSNKLYLSFLDYSKTRIISIYFNEIGEIEYCSPSFKCEEFGVKVNSLK